MKTISFYRTASGKCPVKEHLDSLTDTQATKIAWVLKLIREIDQVPSKHFKKLVKTKKFGKPELMWEETPSVFLVSFMVKS